MTACCCDDDYCRACREQERDCTRPELVNAILGVQWSLLLEKLKPGLWSLDASPARFTQMLTRLKAARA